jgi:hypothetical protein
MAWLFVGWWLASVRLSAWLVTAGYPRAGLVAGWLTGYRVAWVLARGFGWHPFGG